MWSVVGGLDHPPKQVQVQLSYGGPRDEVASPQCFIPLPSHTILTTKMKLTTVAFTFLLASTSNPVANAQPYGDCSLSTYYSSLPASPLDAARDDMHALVMNTHRKQLPYTSTNPDVWDALIALDGDGAGNVKLIYANILPLVPATPYDSGTCQYWNREHL